MDLLHYEMFKIKEAEYVRVAKQERAAKLLNQLEQAHGKRTQEQEETNETMRIQYVQASTRR
ncbi:MAG: hypothetical protein ACOYLB_04745 [Phototrophicaceae bacterium]